MNTYRTKGVCAQAIQFDVKDGKVTGVQFMGGCSGNTQGVAALCVGRKAEDLIPTLKGIRCGAKSTSCPDQLAAALEAALKESQGQ